MNTRIIRLGKVYENLACLLLTIFFIQRYLIFHIDLIEHEETLGGIFLFKQKSTEDPFFSILASYRSSYLILIPQFQTILY